MSRYKTALLPTDDLSVGSIFGDGFHEAANPPRLGVIDEALKTAEDLTKQFHLKNMRGQTDISLLDQAVKAVNVAYNALMPTLSKPGGGRYDFSYTQNFDPRLIDMFERAANVLETRGNYTVETDPKLALKSYKGALRAYEQIVKFEPGMEQPDESRIDFASRQVEKLKGFVEQLTERLKPEKAAAPSVAAPAPDRAGP